MSYPVHPFAEIFPLTGEVDFSALTHDILINGLLDPIVIYNEQILDGRNRVNACANAGVKPRYVPFEGDDAAALKFVISKNLCRRHLDQSQRAMVAARIADAKNGGDRKSDAIREPAGPLISLDAAAKSMGVGRRSAIRARKVQASGDKALIAEVDAGNIPVTTAARIADLPEPERKEAIVQARAPRSAAKPKPAPEPTVDPMDTDEGVELLAAFIDAATALHRQFGTAVIDEQWSRWRRSVK